MAPVPTSQDIYRGDGSKQDYLAPLSGINHFIEPRLKPVDAQREQDRLDAERISVPVSASTEIIVAIERETDSQLTASGMRPEDMQRQDGEHVWTAVIAAIAQAKEKT